MGKQRKGGLPYLKTSLKIDWDSGRGVPPLQQKSLIADAIQYLRDSDSAEAEDATQASHPLSVVTEHAGFGLQACLDLVKTESSAIVFLDSACPRPSAVSNALGLYFSNYADTAKVYCLDGVAELLSSELNRKTNAFVLKSCPEALRELIETTLTPLRVQSARSNTASYVPVALVKSMGKPDKVKK